MDANNSEIEITPQMIDAGFQVLQGSSLGDVILKADKCMVAEIYRAMDSVRRATSSDKL